MENKEKYGEITRMLLEYAKENEPVSYTELNKFYQMEIHGKDSYEPVSDRGGSFVHHMRSMKNKRRRPYSGKVEYLLKDRAAGHLGKYKLIVE